MRSKIYFFLQFFRAQAPIPQAQRPIAITSSFYNAPGQNVNSLNTWDYAFEAENGIKQAAAGEMKQICIDKATDWIKNHHELRAQTEHLVKEFLAEDAL